MIFLCIETTEFGVNKKKKLEIPLKAEQTWILFYPAVARLEIGKYSVNHVIQEEGEKPQITQILLWR